MTSFDTLLWLPPIAFVLDMLAGDPRWLPHPVRAIGHLLGPLERLGRALGATRPAGVVCTVLAVLCAGGAVALAGALPVVGAVVSLWLAYAGLALGCLLREGRAALHAVEHGSLEDGRAALAMLVSRDTSALDRDGLRRALAETLAENFNDGFVAPFLWLVAGGPVGLWCYKTVSTMDSMWGYRTERWERLGWACARLDDVLAWVPARCCVVLLWVTAPFAGVPGQWPGLPRVASDARRMESPNAGWPMAAAAWLHGAYMGGSAVYFGKVKEKPLLGPADTQWDGPRIEGLLRHLRLAGLAGAVTLWLAALLAGWIFGVPW